MLYNGDDKWTAPDNIDQLIETEIDLGSYGLHFEHLVIAGNAYGKEWLAKVDNIIAMVANGLPLPTIATLLVLPLSEVEHLLAEPHAPANAESGQTPGA